MEAHQCPAITNNLKRLRLSHKLVLFSLNCSGPYKIRLGMIDKSATDKKLLRKVSESGQIDSYGECVGLTNNIYPSSLEV